MFNEFPLSQIQSPYFFDKPMCHNLFLQQLRFWIFCLIKFHSSLVSMEIK